MGAARKEASRVDFDSQIKLEFHSAAVTSDAGLVAYRELDEALGLTTMADDVFGDPRPGHSQVLPWPRGGCLDTLGMTRRGVQTGPRRDTSGGCHARITRNGAPPGSSGAFGLRRNALNTPCTKERPEKMVGATGGAVQ